MSLSRRRFMEAGAAAAAGLACGCAQSGRAEGEPKKIPIGLQLYAVRGEFAKDVPATLKAVAAIGYKGVEFWGYEGTPNVYQQYDARALRKMLDDLGLVCCGIHLQVKALEAAQLATTIENNRILGNRLLIVAAAKEKMGSEDAVKGFAEFLTAASAACRPHGMRVGYHAHGFDFAKIGDRFAWDILFSQAGPDVVMQMDVGNCLGGGGDPVASLTAFQKRALTLHLREHQDKTFESPWYKDVFRLCETGPTQWYVVEIGGKDGLGFDTPRDALTRLRKLGK